MPRRSIFIAITVFMLLFPFTALGQDGRMGVLRGYLDVALGDESPYGGVFSYINDGDTVSTVVFRPKSMRNAGQMCNLFEAYY